MKGGQRKMIIGGMQKMTLLDYPGRIACIIFTHGCNFRCPFCHNAPLVTDQPSVMSVDEVMEYLKKRIGILDGVCVSGGEPTLQKDLLGFLEEIKALGYSVKLDTNGTSPGVIKEAVERGLCDYVAMDIKNSREKYQKTAASCVDMSLIEQSVDYLLGGAVDYEFRTTVTRQLHTEDDIRAIGEWIKGAKRYFLQTFVCSGELVGEGMSAYSNDEMNALAEAVREYVPNACVR